jgi:hypothetical protein
VKVSGYHLEQHQRGNGSLEKRTCWEGETAEETTAKQPRYADTSGGDGK